MSLNKFVYRKLLLLCALSALLMSCAQRFPTPLIDTRPDQLSGPYEESGKAIVIMSGDVNYRIKTALIDEWRNTDALMVFVKKKPYMVKENGKDQAKLYFLAGSEKPKIYVLEPGHYGMSGIGKKGSSVSGAMYPGAGWDSETGKPVFGDFEIEAGDVVYLGHVHMHILDSEGPFIAKFTVEDRAEEIPAALVDAFGDEHEKFLSKLENRPIKLREKM